jgi:energy-coupling factor transporter ATP-binding protein EcfA2
MFSAENIGWIFMTIAGSVILRNFRCFGMGNPVEIPFGPGFSAFIGVNNSGKSTAIKAIFELRSLFLNLPLIVFGRMKNPELYPNGVPSTDHLFHDSEPSKFLVSIRIEDEFCVSEGDDFYAAREIKVECYPAPNGSVKLIEVVGVSSGGHVKSFDLSSVTSTGQRSTADDDRIRWIQYSNGWVVDYRKIFDFLADIASAVYYPAFRNAINEGGGNYYDIPVGTSLVSSWDAWKAGEHKQKNKAISNVEKRICTLLGFDSLQINADSSNKTLRIDINGRPMVLKEVGAGISQLIIVLAAATIQKPKYILIDEPEQNLHPQLQLDFLSALASAADIGVIFTTHSIGLARSVAEKIIVVTKGVDGFSSVHSLGDGRAGFGQLLGELSYSSRAELGCTKILLVEGPTEVLCFQEFLRKLGKDSKYIIIPLCGANCIRAGMSYVLSEFCRLVEPESIFGFIDSEKKYASDVVAAERVSFVEDCRQLGIRVEISERRATENYFEKNAINSVVGDDFVPLGPFQKLSDLEKRWGKGVNWKIAAKTKLSDIESTDLYRFLVSLP